MSILESREALLLEQNAFHKSLTGLEKRNSTGYSLNMDAPEHLMTEYLQRNERIRHLIGESFGSSISLRTSERQEKPEVPETKDDLTSITSSPQQCPQKGFMKSVVSSVLSSPLRRKSLATNEGEQQDPAAYSLIVADYFSQGQNLISKNASSNDALRSEYMENYSKERTSSCVSVISNAEKYNDSELESEILDVKSVGNSISTPSLSLNALLKSFNSKIKDFVNPYLEGKQQAASPSEVRNALKPIVDSLVENITSKLSYGFSKDKSGESEEIISLSKLSVNLLQQLPEYEKFPNSKPNSNMANLYRRESSGRFICSPKKDMSVAEIFKKGRKKTTSFRFLAEEL